MDDDQTLVAAARRGDDSAWAVIYDRYADKLHDHCFRILRDRDEAADALHDAFIAASRNLHQLRDPSRLRPWLYSISRHCALRRLKARDRVELTDAPDDMTAPDTDLDRGMAAEELGELVWAAAEGLNPRDQALLDLSVRQGLEGQDLADAMGTSLSNSYVMLSRMRDQVERSLGALLIARLGRDDCDELDGLLQGWDGKFSPLLRKRVARHVDSCDVCSHKRSTVASPLALLAVVPVAPAPAMLKGRIISSVRNWEVYDSPTVKWTKGGFASLDDGRGPRRISGAWMATAVAVLLLLGGVFLAVQGTGGGGGKSDLETAGGVARDRERVTTTTPASTTTDPLALDPTGASTTIAGTPPTTVTPGSTPPTTVAPGGTTPTSKPAPTTTTPVSITSASASATAVECGGSVTVTVHTTGSPEKVRVVSTAGNRTLSGGDGTYTGTVGAFNTNGSQTLVAQAYANGKIVSTKNITVRVSGCDDPAPAGSSTTQPPITGNN
jgi:RNA polymerase sigma factor (sigma-70 family)